MGRLLHTIGRVCQSAYERSKTGSAVAVLQLLPVMVLRNSIGRLLHTIGRVCQSAYERSKTGSAVEVPTASSRDGLKEKHGHTAAYHWSGLSAHERSKPGSAVAVPRCVFP